MLEPTKRIEIELLKQPFQRMERFQVQLDIISGLAKFSNNMIISQHLSEIRSWRYVLRYE